MNIVGFNLIKILAERIKPLNNPAINTNIQFTDFEKEKIDFLSQGEAVKLNFKYDLTYSPQSEQKKIKDEDKQAEIIVQGFLILSVSKDELKEFEKSWKKKQVPEKHIISLYNFILRRCSIKTLSLQDDIGIPSPYLNFPAISKNQDNSA